MNIPAGVEDAMREGKGLKKKGVTAGWFNDHPRVMCPVWLEISCHAPAPVFIQEVNNIYYLLPDCKSFPRSERFLIDFCFLFGHGVDLCAVHF